MEVALRIHRLEHFGNGICRNVFQNFEVPCCTSVKKRHLSGMLLVYYCHIVSAELTLSSRSGAAAHPPET